MTGIPAALSTSGESRRSLFIPSYGLGKAMVTPGNACPLRGVESIRIPPLAIPHGETKNADQDTDATAIQGRVSYSLPSAHSVAQKLAGFALPLVP